MANTANLDLVKPAGTDHALVSVLNQNSDKIDAFAGKTNAAMASVQDGIAIVADGDTHAAIASGQFVYVKNHSTLAEGLYRATAAIATDAALSTSNLAADASGGMNALKSDIDTLNSNMKNWETVFEDSTSITGLTVIGYKNSGLHLGLIRVVGGSTTTPSGRYSITFPSGFRLFNNYISVLNPLYITVAGASGYIDVSYSAVSINISANSTWTAGSIMFPIV